MKMDQTCPHCGITEAAGAYCTLCFRRTQPGWLHRPVQSVSAQGRKAPFRRQETRRAKP